MSNEPLELEYPIPFPLKVIGLDEPDFEDFVVSIVRLHVPELLEENIISKLSTSIVIDTTPLIALAAATGSLEILKALYGRIVVPFEVREEMLAAARAAGMPGRFARIDASLTLEAVRAQVLSALSARLER